METYCLTCKRRTKNIDSILQTTANNRKRIKSNCAICNRGKSRFVDSSIVEGKAIDIHSLIGKLPRPKKGFTLPNHKYTGPYNPLSEQLDQFDRPLPGQEPFNQVDKISLFHDICYRDHADNKRECDRKMLISLKDMIPKNTRERIDRAFVSTIIGAKNKLGLGIATKKKRRYGQIH